MQLSHWSPYRSARAQRYDETNLEREFVYMLYICSVDQNVFVLREGPGSVIIKCVNSITLRNCHIFSLAPLLLYELKTLQNSKHRPQHKKALIGPKLS